MFHPNSATIITGAASGIGFSIAKGLAGEHVQLALLDQNIDQLNVVTKIIKHRIQNIIQSQCYG